MPNKSAFAAAEWLRSASTGHCGATTSVGDCFHGAQGTLGLSRLESQAGWSTAVAACLHRCTKCRNCRFISVSLQHQDCSWYAKCDRIQRDVFCFQSGIASRPSRDASTAEIGVAANLPAADSSPPVPWDRAAASLSPASIAILQASDRAAPLPISAAYERRNGRLRPRAAFGGQAGGGIRSLAATLNRAYAALHGYTYIYARIMGGCGRGLAAWCQLPAVMGLLRERMTGPEQWTRQQSPPQPPPHRFSWVLAIDEDVAFNSRMTFVQWLGLAQRTPSRSVDRPASGHARSHCRGRCLPMQRLNEASALLDSICQEDFHTAQEAPCLMVGKEIGGWPGINVGSRFVRASLRTQRLLHFWWQWPLQLPTSQERAAYLDHFPGEQNAFNDAILTNSSFSRCVHVAPNADLYGEPGHYTRHYTGVGVDKERLFLEAHATPSKLDGLLAFPPWNTTACTPFRRNVRMPASGSASGNVATEIEYTIHCQLPIQGGAAALEMLREAEAERITISTAPLLGTG